MARKSRYRIGEKSFSTSEYQKLLAAIDTHEDDVLIKLAVACGFRREDIVNLAIANINLEAGQIRFVEKKKHEYKGGPSIIRTVPIGPQMVQTLRMYLAELPEDQEYLFPFCSKTAYNRLRRLCDRAKIPRRPFHALRSTCIKRCQAAGWTIEQVAALVNDTIKVIQEHYNTPSEDEVREAAQGREHI